MKEYIEPEIEIIEYRIADVIAASTVTTTSTFDGSTTIGDENDWGTSNGDETLVVNGGGGEFSGDGGFDD